MDPKTHFRKMRGFTLIELMITVVIIGILTAIAYPSYQEYVRRGNRAEARSILLEDAQILERNYTTANRYDLDSVGVAPVIIAVSPKSAPAGKQKYDIVAAYGAAPAQTFTLTATPTAGNMMAGDACGAYTLSNTGVLASGGPAADCLAH